MNRPQLLDPFVVCHDQPILAADGVLQCFRGFGHVLILVDDDKGNLREVKGKVVRYTPLPLMGKVDRLLVLPEVVLVPPWGIVRDEGSHKREQVSMEGVLLGTDMR